MLLAALAVMLLITGAVGQGKYVLLESQPGITLQKLGYSEADPGKQYVLVNIKVENHGYDAFKLDPYCFKMTVNKIVYDRDYLGSMAENGYPPLEDVTLEDGGEISMRLRLRPQSLSESFPINMWVKCLT
jgi:hypothetical protein